MSSWRWGRGYVENIAATVVCVLRSEPAALGVFNLGDPFVLSEKEWIEQIAGAANWDGKIEALPDEQLLQPLRLPYNLAQDLSIDASHFRQTTGFSEPLNLKDSLRKTIAWHRANPRQLSAEVMFSPTTGQRIL